MSNQVANDILTQLGGRRFPVMTGSKNFIAGENSLSMKLSRNKSGANYLRITLTPMDVYAMEFFSARGGAELKEKAKREDVYCDQLQKMFTDVTGLYTNL